MSNKWEYGGVYKNYNMDGEIKVGTGTLKVHDIFNPLPSFMTDADCIFIDPPCSLANINTFYTKADRTDYQESFEPFTQRLFECIDEIKPNKLFLEVFKSNKARFISECEKRYSNVTVYDTTYYHSKSKRCYVIACSNDSDTSNYPFNDMDEENVIEWVCKNVDYNCIGDLCMGQGLVGYNAFINNRKFVGTELNKKRLAVLVDKITKYKKA